MPRDLFAEYGVDPATVGNNANTDSSSSTLNVPSAPPRDLFAEYGVNPQEANQGSWMPTSSMRDILGGIATGIQNAHNFLTPKSMNTNYDFNAPGSIGLGIDYPTQGDKAVQGIAQYAPAAFLPEAPLIGDALGTGSWAARTAGKYLPNIVPQGTYGAAQNPDDRITGALYGAGGAALGQAGGDLLNVLRPSQLFRGKLSPQELQENLDATQGTNTSLGRVVESPTLNRLQENVLPHILFSGAEDTMQNTANQVTNQGNQIMQKLGSGFSNARGTLGSQIQDALQKASTQATADKIAMYGKVNDLADNNNLEVGRENLRSTAQNALDSVNSSFELKPTVDPGLISTLKNISSNPNSTSFLNQQALSTVSPDVDSLMKSNVFKGKLNDMANAYYSDGKIYEYKIMKSLKDALGNDINSSIENSGNNELKNAYQEAQQNYATNFAPFEDPDIVKFTREGGDSDLILNHFLRAGPNDRGQLLSKLQDAISSPTAGVQTSKAMHTPVVRNQGSPAQPGGQMSQSPLQNTQSLSQPGSTLLPYAYLSRSLDEDGQVNPIKFAQLYNKLGQNQKNILIKDPEMRNMLDNYTNLVGKNKEAFNLMFNPKTGARNTGALWDLFQLAGSVGGAHFGGALGAIGGQAATSLAGKAANHLLTSPSFRESIVKAMIKNNKWQTPQLAKSAGGALGSMIGNSNSEQ